VCPKGVDPTSIWFGPEGIEYAIKHQGLELVSKIGEVIARWSFVDTKIGHTFVSLLDTKAHVGAAVYVSLRSGATQTAVLDAIRDLLFEEEQRDMLTAVRAVTRAARDGRNDVAHGIWGFTDSVADGLLVMSARSHLMEHGETHTKRATDAEKRGESAVWVIRPDSIPGLKDHSQIQVYRKQDFESLIKQIDHARWVWGLFFTLFMQHQKARASIYDDLYKEPGIQEAVERARKNRERSGP
jgi:hypothetical protein